MDFEPSRNGGCKNRNCHETKGHDSRSILSKKGPTLQWLPCDMLGLPSITFKRMFVGFLVLGVFIFSLCSFKIGFSTRELQAIDLKKMDQQEFVKIGLKEQIAMDEADLAMKHKPSHRSRPWKELIIDKSGTDLRLRSTIEEELKKIQVMPFVSWGVYHMYRSTFPPEINIPNVNADLPYDGKPPTSTKLESSQILLAHRLPSSRRLSYSIRNWENRMNIDKPKNLAKSVTVE